MKSYSVYFFYFYFFAFIQSYKENYGCMADEQRFDCEGGMSSVDDNLK